MSRISIFFLLALSLWLGWSCRPTNDSEKVAEVDGTVLTRAEIDRSGGKQLQNLRRQLYQLERQKLDEYIGATLLTREAKERGISVSTLLEQEVNSKILPVADDEVEAFYNSNKARLPVELDKVREQIREFLRGQKIEAQKALYMNSLRSRSKITTYLKPPPVFRAEVSANGAPFKGPEKAPVTIVKFEDFQCPFCKQVQPTIAEILSRYNGKIRIVHKDLPLDAIHPQARQAAEAARCAGEQGQFWSYHDKLYANSPKANPEDLKSYAKEVGLELASFERCLASGKYKAVVQQDLSEGTQLGITGTPAFFINGREISGSQPVQVFAAMIDEELAQVK